MKNLILTGAFLAFLAVSTEAQQVTVDYQKRTRNSQLRITFTGGFGHGFGFGYPGIYRPFLGSWTGISVGGAYTSFYSGGLHPYWGPYSHPGAGFPSYYPPMIPDYSPGPPRRAERGVADRVHEHDAHRRIEVGQRRFKAMDYRGAVIEFRQAVLADASSGPAQAHFALALLVTGDLRNADKALRAAAERMPFAKIDLPSFFRDAAERARILGMLSKVAGEGALAAAWAEMLAGEGARLRQMAGQDAAAKKLLGP